jgi:hypothetical protein
VPVARDLTAKFNPSLSRDGAKLAYAAFGGFRNPVNEVRLTNLATGEEKAYPVRVPWEVRHPGSARMAAFFPTAISRKVNPGPSS